MSVTWEYNMVHLGVKMFLISSTMRSKQYLPQSAAFTRVGSQLVLSLLYYLIYHDFNDFIWKHEQNQNNPRSILIVELGRGIKLL